MLLRKCSSVPREFTLLLKGGLFIIHCVTEFHIVDFVYDFEKSILHDKFTWVIKFGNICLHFFFI